MGIFSSRPSASAAANGGKAGGGTGTGVNSNKKTRSTGESSSLSDERRDTPPGGGGGGPGRQQQQQVVVKMTPLQQQQQAVRQQQQQQQQQGGNVSSQQPSSSRKQGSGAPPSTTNNTSNSSRKQGSGASTATNGATNRRPTTTNSPAVEAIQREASSNSSQRGMIRSQRLSISVTASPKENTESIKAQMKEDGNPTWESQENRTKFREGLNLMRTLYTWDQVPLDFFVDEQVEERSALSRLSVSLTSLPRVQSVKKPNVNVATPVAPPPSSRGVVESPRTRRASVATSNPVVVKTPDELPVVPGRRTVGPATPQGNRAAAGPVGGAGGGNKQVEVAIAMESRPRRHSATSVEQVYVRLSQNEDRVFQVNNPLRGGDGRMVERSINGPSVRTVQEEGATENIDQQASAATSMSTSASSSSHANAVGGVHMEQFTAYRRSVDFTDPRRTSVVHRKSVVTSPSSTMVSVPMPKTMLSDEDVDNML